jgi:hypothetical protein
MRARLSRINARTTAAALALSCAVAGGGALLTAPAGAATIPVNPSTGLRPGVTPLVVPGARAAVQPFSAAQHLSYFGGRVVSNVQVVQVLYGTGSYAPEVATTTAPSIASFYANVTNSNYFDWLSEYDTPTGTHQHIGRGTFLSQVQITPAAAHNGATITDAQIQAEISSQIAAGTLPAPTRDAAGNDNTYYALFFPHGKTISQGGSVSCHAGGFAAYHGTIANAGGLGEVYYGVQPDFQAGSGCDTGTGSGTRAQNEMSVASHELVETVTDPEVGIGTVIGAPLAWYNSAFGEIGDICNAQQGSIVGGDGFTYTVQQQFDNVSNTCVTIGPLPVVPSVSIGDVTALEGDTTTRTMTFPVTLSTPSTTAVTVQYAITGATATAGPKPTAGVDVVAKTGTLTFALTAAGTTPITKTVVATIHGDTTPESAETFHVTLSAPTGGYALGRDTGTGTILDDDGVAAGRTFGIGDVVIRAARSGAQKVSVPVAMSSKAAAPVTVTYQVTFGTASYSTTAAGGGDFGGKLNGTLTFPAGATVKPIALPIWPDAAGGDADKTFTITISGLSDGTITLVRSAGTVTIIGA